MNKIYSTLSVIGGISVVFAIIAFTGMYDNDILVSDSDMMTPYMPSNITKANPNILVGSGNGSWRTTNISDVADSIVYTIEGTVIKVGDPIEWFEPGTSGRGHGTVPITISVDEVYKGNVESETFTFFINGMLVIPGLTIDDKPSDSSPENRIFYLFPWEPQFEIGEKVIVHLTKNSLTKNSIISNDNNTINDENIQSLTSNYDSVQLGKYGKYQLRDSQAFNEKFSMGISLQDAVFQSMVP